MGSEAFSWADRIKAVEREHRAVRFAADQLLQSLQDGTKAIQDNLKRRDIDRASDNLDGTYVIRLFAEFEIALKRYLESKKIKIPRDAKPLLDKVAVRVGFSGDILLNAHKVREFRNRLVHGREDGGELLTIRQATSHLCTFLSRLQPAW
ncbi:MAG TPA: hypothetical protein VGN42_13705 [Pirellulales bacterium]|jgi:hypothetical protein|nr:hypothetical protein [Pirellulales bacterium]